MKSGVRRFKKHLSPSLVISLVALFVVLSGGAYALTAKPKANSVGAKALKPVIVTTAGGTVNPGTLGDFTATCLPNQQVIGGGVIRDSATTALQLLESGARGNGWHGQVFSTSAAPHTVTVQALCLKK